MDAGRSFWLAPLFLLFGVLAPAVCVVWFMNAAVNSESDAARQSLNEAYRSSMRLLRDRADWFWRDRAAAIEAALRDSEPVAFQEIVTRGLADSVVMPHYPAFSAEGLNDPMAGRLDWRSASELERMVGRLADAAAAYGKIADSESNRFVAARAAQGRIRCLIRKGDKESALAVIRQYFGKGRLRFEKDSAGRLIAADEMLLAIRVLKTDDPRAKVAISTLGDVLNEYARFQMPSAQRLFLMDELRAVPGAPGTPTREAERSALRFLEIDSAESADRGLQRTRVPDLWKLPLSTGRAAALYRTGSIQEVTRDFLKKQNLLLNADFIVLPPGASASSEAIAAGSELPGWTLSFALLDPRRLENTIRARIASYLWIGYLMIACLTVTGVFAAQWLRREARLAQLKTDLVASVSHELRTPLGSIKLLVETLLDEAAPDPTKVHEYLKLIAGENQRLTKLIENFLTFSRIERYRQQFVFAPTLVSAVVAKGVAAMGERLHPPACRFEMDLTAGGTTIQADEDALVTVLVNLLDNACKYSPNGRNISITARESEGKVTFSVKDSGIGIPAREQRRIFRRFYQVDRRLARETGGCGLGLSIVETLVRAHGGEVRVESSPGCGSIFSVILPCTAPIARKAREVA